MKPIFNFLFYIVLLPVLFILAYPLKFIRASSSVQSAVCAVIVVSAILFIYVLEEDKKDKKPTFTSHLFKQLLTATIACISIVLLKYGLDIKAFAISLTIGYSVVLFMPVLKYILRHY